MDSAEDEDNRNGVVEEEETNPSKPPKIIMKHENFFEIIKSYPCLFNKSQTSCNKKIKDRALLEIKEKVKQIHGINLNCSQIRKKLENMKTLAKAKREKIEMGDWEARYKYYEKELLKLMDYKSYTLAQFITDPEQCDASADSSLFLKYEAEDEMSQDEEATSSLPPPVLASNIEHPRMEIKSEKHDDTLQFENQIKELNSKDTDSSTSEEEKLPTKLGFGIREKDFFDIVKDHDCLFEKSQAPHIKITKQNALEDVQKKLKTIHGLNLNSLQIRKKIDNMKGRVKGRFDSWKRRNVPRYKLKRHERQLLNLMKSKKLLDAELCAELNPSENSNDAEEVNVVKEETNFLASRNSPNLLNNTDPMPSEESNQLSLLELQKEVLLEQRDLNRQQNELNNLQKEIFTLKRNKLLLEIDLLKKTKNV